MNLCHAASSLAQDSSQQEGNGKEARIDPGKGVLFGWNFSLEVELLVKRL
jgi:hypothetical protein